MTAALHIGSFAFLLAALILGVTMPTSGLWFFFLTSAVICRVILASPKGTI